MRNTKYENLVGNLISALLLSATVFTWKSGTDPINVPKEFILVSGSFFLFGIIGFKFKQKAKSIEFKAQILFFLFCLALFSSFFLSAAPKTHQLYGVLGRSLGLLTYLSLAILFYATVVNRSTNLIRYSQICLQIAFIYNAALCLLQLRGMEPLGYNNIFRVPLGTFGNPNFVSAFFGIFGSCFFAYLFTKDVKIYYKVFIVLELILGIFLINKTGSRQGLIILLAGFSLVIFFFLKSLRGKRRVLLAYSIFMSPIIFSAALGVFKIGPLGELIYKVSISLRIEYWKAALNMIQSNPLSGVGLNSYGDWYRFSRDASAIILPGAEIVTNSSHSVPLDFGVTGGFPLLLAYLLIQLLVVASIFQIVRRFDHYDFRLVGLIAGWLSFTLQSLISIDQIGISVWGWFFSGSIIACRIKLSNENVPSANIRSHQESKKRHEKESSQIPALPIVFGSIMGIFGLLLSIPNFQADLKWGMAMRTGDINQIKSSAEAWPQDDMRLGTAAYIFGDNKLWDEALIYANKTVGFNPRSYSAWRMILANPRATVEQRRAALEKMKSLDPKNLTLNNLAVK
jgi:O-antigen ligase